MGNIENIGTVIGVVLSAIALFTLLLSVPRKKFSSWLINQKKEVTKDAVKEFAKISNSQFQELSEKIDISNEKLNKKIEKIATDNERQINIFEERMEKLSEVQKQQLRTSIVNLYDKSSIRGYLTHYEKKNLLMEFSIYKEVLHGNSYIEGIVKEMDKLPVQDKK